MQGVKRSQQSVQANDGRSPITAPLIAQRETARLQLAALPARKRVPTADQVNPDLFRQAVLEAWTRRPLEERRRALAKVLDRVTLSPGGVHIRYDAAGFCGHDRSSPPQDPASTSSRGPSQGA